MSQHMRFTHVRLRNWRNFTKVDVALANRVFVVGPNAIGKSNLLDVFRFLRDLTLDGGGLAAAVKARRGLAKVRSLHYRGPASSDVSIEAEVSGPGDVMWKYQLDFNRTGAKAESPVQVTRESVCRRAARGDWVPVADDRPNREDEKDPKRLTQTALQQVTQNGEFRELWEFFRGISYLHLVPQLIRDEQRPAAETLAGDQYGRDLLSRIRAVPKRSQQSRLKRMRDVLQIAVPQLSDLDLVLDDESRPHLQAAFKHWRGPAAKQDEREFSDGTLRLIGLLWALQEKAGPLLLEEPELSLHTAVVRQLAPFIARAQRGAGGRQAFISTHSDELMSDPGIGPKEILLIRPAKEGSEVLLGADDSAIREALQGGLTAADVVMPLTAKENIDLFANAEP